MALQWLWLAMTGGSLVYAAFCGRGPEMLAAALGATADAITLTLTLGAGYLLFCGWMRILQALGAPGALERLVHPALRVLMPGVRRKEARQAVCMNLSMNMLGLGNAATPQGMEAMRLMEEERKKAPCVEHDMYMLLILNATSIQLIPTTVLALRAAAGSADAGAIVLPSLVCTAVSTAVGAVLGLICRRRREARRA